MAGELSLKTPSTGLVTLVPTDTATDKTITLPATTGTMVVQDGTNTTTINNLAYTGTLTGGTGVVNIGSGQVYKDASGNVGIGTTTPASKFQVNGALRTGGVGANTALAVYTESTGISIEAFQDNTPATKRDIYLAAFGGNVGIGTVSPSAKLTVSSGEARIDLAATNGGGRNFNLYSGGGGNVGAGAFAIAEGGATQRFVIIGGGTGESVRITSSGDLLVGTTGQPSGSVGGGGFLRESFSRSVLYLASTTTGTANLAAFVNPNGVIGVISTSGSSTSYVTSSDYRLKENVAPMTGALATVAALKPCTYTWKSDGSAGQGFIAHELQEVVPDCVTGTKDAVDKDGKPQYQGVDTSFLVATLTAAIQELTARLEVLENK